MDKRLICLVFSMFVMAGLCAYGQEGEQDVIKQTNGKELDGGLVAEETYQGITYKRGPTLTMQVNWADITEIVYGGKPEALESAERSFSSGDYEKALQGYSIVAKACREEKMRKIFLHQALLGLARCQAVANIDQAYNSYSELIKTRTSRYLKEAYIECIDMLIRAGAQNAAYFKRAEEMIKDAKDTVEKLQDFKAKDEVLQKITFYGAKILEANKEYLSAKDKYQKMKASMSKTPENAIALADATLGMVRCSIELKELSDAEDKLNQFLDKETPTPEENYPVVMAEAWNLFGTIYYRKAEEEKDRAAQKNLYKNALEGFLHGVVQFVPREEDLPIEHAKSLYYSADCYLKLAEMIKESNQETADKYKERAKNHLTKIVNEIKIPAWTKPAEDLLKRVK